MHNILIIGSGGREHAFAWHLNQSPLCKQIFVAPGNAGTATLATNLPIGVTDFEALGKACITHGIDLVLVGPEVPLVAGVVDYFRNETALTHIKIVGPSQSGARLEGSKDFSKAFMQRHQIPTAIYQTFVAAELDAAIAYSQTQTLPVVLKADGLAAGKGVVIAASYAEAEQTLREMLLEQKFGEASSKVVIEQFLDGIELSVFVLTDGQSYKILPEAKDYKRIGEGDTGLNTGGMGAVSPVPFADAAFMQKVEKRIIKPTIEGLNKDKIDYQGFIFIGLMNVGGDPYVIEYNVRMGDPETEAVVPRITSDLVELLWAAATQNLHNVPLQVTDQVAVAAVLASGGYPENHETGFVIENKVNDLHTHVFHAGTKLDEAGQVLTNGGRVIVVSALAQDFATARKQAMAAAEQISWHKKYFRRDIGQDLEKYFEVI